MKRILMLGWEYPPSISGGLGIASQGIARALANRDHNVTFFVPNIEKDQKEPIVQMVDAHDYEPQSFEPLKTIEDKIEKYSIGSKLIPYLPPEYFIQQKTETRLLDILEDEDSGLLEEIELTGQYKETLIAEIQKYGLLAASFAYEKKFDLVHAHDWMTFKPALLIKELTGVPLIMHVHSTEIDRNGSYADSGIMEEEKDGLEQADGIIAVSKSVRSQLIKSYGIPKSKISIIPNGYTPMSGRSSSKRNRKHVKIGFIGRLVNQKGVLHFVDIAREIRKYVNNARFEIVGDGYLKDDLKSKIIQLNLNKQFIFHGFLSHEKTISKMKGFDLLIVPSLSEPFGLVALEAVNNKVPMIISTGAGITEFIKHIPTCQPWDIFNFAKLVHRLLNENDLREKVLDITYEEAQSLTWESTAKQTEMIYNKVVA